MTSKRTRFLFLLAVATLACPNARADSVADFVNGYLKKKQIPGCAILVRKDGEVVLSEGYGTANLEHNVAVTPKTVFQSASVGKQFTAMAVMMLAEEGKLSLGDQVSKFLKVPSSWSAITIRHLLTHTAGLGDYPEDFSLQKDYSEAELLKMVTGQELDFEPGEKWSYSNLGYLTLGLVIHKVTGKFYGDVLQERIFKKLGMTSTRIISEADIIPNRAAGYRLVKGELKNQEWVAPSANTTADGSLYFNIEDLAKWAEALDKQTLLSAEGFRQMWTPAELNDGSKTSYGFGWSLEKNALDHRLIEHDGAWQGFATYIGRHPDERLTVVVLCNRAGANADYIAKVVAGFYVPGLGPRSRSNTDVKPEVLQSHARNYCLNNRLTVKIVAVDDHLETTWLGQKLILMPESENLFSEEDSNRTVRFITAREHRVTAAAISVPEDLTLQRLP